MGTENLDPKRIDRALGLIADALSRNAEKADAILKDEGVDVSESIAKNLAFVKQMQGKAKLRTAARERIRREPRLAKLREAANETVRGLSKNLKKARLKQLAFDSRKLEVMNDEDIDDALVQAEILRLLEQLDKDEE